MNNIDKLRNKKHMTYNSIGEKAGVSAQYVFLLAKGERKNPSYEVMKSIANALDEKIEKVFELN